MESSDVPVFVDFWAPWCGPCRAAAPIIEEIAQEYAQRVSFVKINVDENKEIVSRFNIFSIPTLAILNRGSVVSEQIGVGANAKASLRTMIENALKKE